uniref:Cyclin N-terminal domain-containing protein n=1 Tax=Plectus sambesii TaxID=2011161 RepID=A0A914V2I5_9BILA
MVLTTTPNFSDGTASLSVDMIQDWLSILMTENSMRIKRAIEFDQLFLTPRAVDYIFTLCARLKLPQDVKFAAALIFDQFMLAHVDQMYASLVELKMRDSKKTREWERIETTIAHQVPLRTLSCIQIASKMHSYHHSLSAKAVMQCLESLGLAYTEESVKRSELRVLKTLDFSVASHHSPVVYIETLLKILHLDDDSLPAQKIWLYAQLVLDVVFIERDAIYNRLMVNVLGQSAGCMTRERMAFLKADWLLLSAAVIVAADSCVRGVNSGDKLIAPLSKVTHLPVEDIADFSVAIMQHFAAVQPLEIAQDSDHS